MQTPSSSHSVPVPECSSLVEADSCCACPVSPSMKLMVGTPLAQGWTCVRPGHLVSHLVLLHRSTEKTAFFSWIATCLWATKWPSSWPWGRAPGKNAVHRRSTARGQEPGGHSRNLVLTKVEAFHPRVTHCEVRTCLIACYVVVFHAELVSMNNALRKVTH